jgi:beta-galactosidase
LKKINFDSNWFFRRQESRTFRTLEEGVPVTLPHDAQIYEQRSAEYQTRTGGGFFRSGNYIYTKRFEAEEDWRGKQVILEFEGVYQWADVNFNGDLIAKQPYGYSSFLVDITDRLHFEKENILIVNANNTAVPNTRWYSGAGIYRHVWLRVGGEVSIAPWGVRVTTPKVSPHSSVVSVRAELSNRAKKNALATVLFTVLDPKGHEVAHSQTDVVVDAEGSIIASADITVAPALLWGVDEPNLYTLQTIVSIDGQKSDSEETIFGIRKVEVDAEQGFRLNGMPMKLKGGCVHHDNGLLGSASFDRAEERKVELLKSAGFNAIRCAHNPPSPAMLDACDRLGMVVINENFDCWRMGKNPNDYNLFFENWWKKDTKAMIYRDFNHPSIIMWSIGNEIGERGGASDGYYWSRRLANFVRGLDNTRPVTAALCRLHEPETEETSIPFASVSAEIDEENDRWGDKTAEFAAPLDVVGYNYLVYRYKFDKQKFPKRIIVGSETFPSQQFEYWMATLENDHVIGDFVWTAIDYLGEAGIGRSDYDINDADIWRNVSYPWHQAWCGDYDICGFKRPQSYFRDILWGVRKIPYIATHHPENFGKTVTMSPWGWNPVSESWNFPGYEGKMVTVEVYSDQDEVELLINGKSQGRKPAGKNHRNTAIFDVTYEPGTITAIAYSAGKATGQFELVTSGKPARLRITADRKTINKEYGDLSYLTIEVVDEEGRIVTYADNTVTFIVEGVGELQAVGNNNPKSEENYFGNKRKAHQGKLMAVVKSIGEAGSISVRASSPGLEDANITIVVE